MRPPLSNTSDLCLELPSVLCSRWIHTSEGAEKEVKCFCILLPLLLFAQVCSEGCVTCGLDYLLQTHTRPMSEQRNTGLDREISCIINTYG